MATIAIIARARAMLVAPGRLAALALLALLIALRALDPSAVEELRLYGFDLEQRIAPRSYTPLPVRIVEIDDASLKRYGQWPWPRTLVADLVRRIAAGKPSAVGFDILFSEPDRLSPGRIAAAVPDLPPAIAGQLAAMPSSEARLAEALRTIPTILGLGASDEPLPAPPGPTRLTLVRESGGDPRPFLASYPALVRSLPEITAAERGRGALVGEPDQDGIVRRVPLMIVAEGHLVPAFALEILRVATARPLGIATGAGGVRAVMLGDLELPTDSRGRAYPHFTPPLEQRYISASALLDGSVQAGVLKDSIVLVGVTGLGLIDVKQTPLGLMQGIEVHAQIVESILTDSLLRRPPKMDRIEIFTALAAGLLVIFALPFHRSRLASQMFTGLLAITLLGGFACFRFGGLLFDGVYPAISALGSFGIMLGESLRAAEAARRRLAAELNRERELKARLEGEFAAARAIQMGLLPRRFPPFPDRHDIDIFALIEPARTVGGDLYDFLLLDANRLFFAIADVSGKGIPAALFMAMTKEVLRAAALRHGAALDLVFAEANAKISAASADMLGEGANMMFVTVFAGVLDLASGAVAYASAGHDSPFEFRPGLGPSQLTAAGGPPLGAVDDFPFAVERLRLAPGEALFLFTDGVSEAMDAGQTLYSIARLTRLLEHAPETDAKGLIEFVRGDLRDFVGSAEQADDITMLALRWLPKRAAAD